MASGGSLPGETEAYVLAITAHPADWFTESGREVEARPLDAALDFAAACRRLPVLRTRVEAAVESAPMRPWGVQVAGHASRATALSMFKRIQGRFAAVLGADPPIVLRDRTGRGRIYAVRIGTDSRGEADALCGRRRRAGGACIVFRN